MVSWNTLRDGVVESCRCWATHWDSFGGLKGLPAVPGPMESLIGLSALYGVADQVTKVMKLRNIHLENQALNAFVYTRSIMVWPTQVMYVYLWIDSIWNLRHFTVSSGSGGGFSGGGGGGFGAF